MTDKLVVFDPNTLKDQVVSKVRLAVMDLIPEDAWKVMVQSAIDDFCRDRTARDQYNHRDITTPSGLKTVVREVMTTELRQRVKDELVLQWGANSNLPGVISENVRELVAANAQDIIRGILGDAIQIAVSNIRNMVPR